MRSLFVLAIVALLFSFAIRSPFWGMVTYWWFGIFRPQDWVYIDISSLRIPLLATVLFFVISVFRGIKPKINDSILGLMFLFYCLMLMSFTIVGCSSNYKFIDPMVYMSFLFIAIFLSVDIVKTRTQLLALVATVSLSLGFYSGKGGLVAMASGGASNYGASNLQGMFSGSNAFAMGTATILFLLVFMYTLIKNETSIKHFPKFVQKHKRVFKWGMILLIMGSVFNIVTLFSRASAIATFLGFVVYYFLGKNKLKVASIAVPLLLLGSLTIPVPEGYKERIESAFAGEENLDTSAASRPFFWGVALDMTSDYPLGVGPGCYRAFYNVYSGGDGRYGYARDVHSSHFQALADNGYLGALVWFLLLFVALKRLFQIRKALFKNGDNIEHSFFYLSFANCLIVAQLIFFIGGSFYSLTYTDLIWLIWGMVVILDRLVKEDIHALEQKNKET